MFADPEFRDQLKALFESPDAEQSAMDELAQQRDNSQADSPPSWQDLKTVVDEALKPSPDLAVTPRLQRIIDQWERGLERLQSPARQKEIHQLRSALLQWNDQNVSAAEELNALEQDVERCLLGEEVSSSPEPPADSQSLGQRQRALVCLLGLIRVAVRNAKTAGTTFPAETSQAGDTTDSTSTSETGPLLTDGPQMRTLAVMFTDMAGSTEFAESFGGRAAYEKREQHNKLLLPLIPEHAGSLVQIIGDALLVVFEDVANAARCAIAMQRRLAEYNQSEHLDVESLEIHIRIGIHYGKVMVFEERGHLELAGRAVNTAARVESGGGKETDQILISTAALAELLPLDEFATEPAAVVEAKGIADPIPLHRVLWQEEAVRLWKTQPKQGATEAVKTLAASTAERLSLAAEDDANTRGCHCLFIDPQTQRGHVVPVWVRVTSGKAPAIRSRIDADRVMLAAAERAITSAFQALRTLGFGDARIEDQDIEWWIEAPNVRFEGASLGLALALATVAAYTGTQIDLETAVTGAVDGTHVLPVAAVGNKWIALRDSGLFDKLVLPTANLKDLSADAQRDPKLQVIDVPDVESAVLDVLGPSLGLAAKRLAAATGPSKSKPSSGEMDVQLWIQPEAKRNLTRDISIVPKDDVHNWQIGQKIRLCAQVNRDCYLSLINIGTTGDVTILIPNSWQAETAVRAGEVVMFPSPQANFSFEIMGPPGRERVIAIASDHPLKLRPEDFNQSGEMHFARPTTRNIAIVANDLAQNELGRCEIDFYVSERTDPSTTRGQKEPQFRSLTLDETT